MINLTLVTDRFKMGGGYYYYMEITNRLLKRGYDVKIVARGGYPWFYKNNKVPIIYPKEPKLLKYISKILQLKYKYIRDFKGLDYYRILSKLFNVDLDFSRIMTKIIPESDLIITGLPSAYLWSYTSRKFKKLAFFPQVWSGYAYFVTKDMRWPLTFYMPFDYYIALTQIEAKIAMSMRKARNTKYFVVRAGVDTNLFTPKRKDSDAKVMVILRPNHKNPELAIDTLNLLSRKLNFNAIIVHDGVLSKFKNNIHFKYEEYQPVPHEKMAELYNEATVFLYTSRMEGYGLPPLEAMACGTPVVTTDNIGGREYLVHEHNALVDKSFSPNVLSEYISRVVRDDELRKRLVRNGLETAKQHNWEIITDNWVKMLKEIEEDEIK